ncbi:MAG: tetratricopeptide repeat protein [Myxococcales bacterium]|nr:tetratricopeptide repeat protein [Myxococcales bacterium]
MSRLQRCLLPGVLFGALLGVLLAAPTAGAASLLSDEQKDDEGEPPALPPLGPVSPGPLPSRPTDAQAAKLLRVPVELFTRSKEGCELLFDRRYRDAKAVFDDIGARYATTGVGPLGVAILYQALMFENFDWKYDAQFRAASAQSRIQLERGLSESGAEPLEHFVLAAIGGLDAVHGLRRGDYLQALGNAVVAMRALQQTEDEAPELMDTRIGDGMYLYWRSVVTASSSFLPNFADRRAEGIRALMQAESGGALLGPGASLVLAYAYVEERDWPRALASTDVNDARYPNCVVNELTRGRILTAMTRYDEALAVYDHVIAQNVQNERVYYFRGIVYSRMGRLAEAEAALRTYLAYPSPPAEYKGQAWFRIGVVRKTLGDVAGARTAFTEGSTLDNASAKLALASL